MLIFESFSSWILTFYHLFWVFYFWFAIRINANLVKWVWDSLRRTDINSSLNVCWEFTKISGSELLFIGRFFDYKFNLLTSNWLLGLLSSLYSLDRFYISGVYPFLLSCPALNVKLSIVSFLETSLFLVSIVTSQPLSSLFI